jgi:hypothetical protein
MSAADPVVRVAIKVDPPKAASCLPDHAMRTLSQLRCTLATVRSRGSAGFAYFWDGGAAYGNPPHGRATEVDPTMPIYALRELFCSLAGCARGFKRACSRGHHHLGVIANV